VLFLLFKNRHNSREARKLRIETITIDRINPAAYNPRVDLQPGDPEYEKLQRSIEEFGYVEPIVWNERTGNMVGGHQRFKILKTRGDTELAVSVVDLDDQQERLLNLALNKVSGRWEEEALARLLDELQADGAKLDLSGFDPDEIDKLLSDFAELPADQLGDFQNRELDVSDFDESRFDCKCPRCGFVFDREDAS
jgi:ParB-like chromosome segregation protein Spo0J